MPMGRGAQREEITTCEMTLDESQILCNYSLYLREDNYFVLKEQAYLKYSQHWWTAFGLLIAATILTCLLITAKKRLHARKLHSKRGTNASGSGCLRISPARHRVQMLSVRLSLCFFLSCIPLSLYQLYPNYIASVFLSALLFLLTVLLLPAWIEREVHKVRSCSTIADIVTLPFVLVWYPLALPITKLFKPHKKDYPYNGDTMVLNGPTNSEGNKRRSYTPESQKSSRDVTKLRSQFSLLTADAIMDAIAGASERVLLLPLSSKQRLEDCKLDERVAVFLVESAADDGTNMTPLAQLDLSVLQSKPHLKVKKVAELWNSSERENLFMEVAKVAADTTLTELASLFRKAHNATVLVTDARTARPGVLATVKVFGSAQTPDRLYPICGGDNMIGRISSCQIALAHATLSKIHACISAYADKAHTVVDRHSANGTSVNTLTLDAGKAHPLEHGDIVCFGNVKCQYFYHCPSETVPAQKIIGLLTLDHVLTAVTRFAELL